MYRFRPAWRAGLVQRPMDDHLLVLDLRTHHSCLLDPSAAAILALCNGSRTIDEIAAELAVTFDTTSAAVLFGVRTTLRSLIAHHFVVDGRLSSDAAPSP